jgi:hypothetical protein
MRFALVVLSLLALPLFAQTRDVRPPRDRARDREIDRPRAIKDANRLAAVLDDMLNERVQFSAETWKQSADEAASLSRDLLRAGVNEDTRQLPRLTSRLQRNVAQKDYDGAREQARTALPHVYAILDRLKS